MVVRSLAVRNNNSTRSGERAGMTVGPSREPAGILFLFLFALLVACSLERLGLQCSMADWTPDCGRERTHCCGRSIPVHVTARSRLSDPFSTSASGSQRRQLLRAGTSHLNRA